MLFLCAGPPNCPSLPFSTAWPGPSSSSALRRLIVLSAAHACGLYRCFAKRYGRRGLGPPTVGKNEGGKIAIKEKWKTGNPPHKICSYLHHDGGLLHGRHLPHPPARRTASPPHQGGQTLQIGQTPTPTTPPSPNHPVANHPPPIASRRLPVVWGQPRTLRRGAAGGLSPQVDWGGRWQGGG